MAIKFAANVEPSGTQNLGASNNKWNNGYFTNINTTDVTTTTINNIYPIILLDTKALPASSSASAVVWSDSRITSNHYLVRWNFSSSAENAAPVSLSWTTAAGSLTVSVTNGTTSESVRPILVRAF